MVAILLATQTYAQTARDVAHQFLVAYGTGDLAKIEHRQTRIELEQLLRVKCVELLATSLLPSEELRGTGVLRGTVFRIETFRSGAPSPQIVAKHLLIKLVDGRIADVEPQQRAFAEQLLADPAQSEALLRDRFDLVDRDLAFELAELTSANNGKPERARIAAKLSGRVADFLADPSASALALLNEVKVAEITGDAPRANRAAREALALAERGDDPQVLMLALYFTARLTTQAGKAADAVAIYEKALALEDRVVWRNTTASVLEGLATAKLTMSDHPGALAFFLRAQKIYEEIGDTSGLLDVEAALGSVMQHTGMADLAIAHFRRAYDLGKQVPGSESRMAEVLVMMSDSLSNAARQQEARKVLEEALVLAESSKAIRILGQAHGSLGQVLRRQGDYAGAIEHLEKARAIFESTKRPRLLGRILLEMALTRFDAGEWRSALENANACVKQGRTVNDLYQQVECGRIAGDAHLALGDSENALASLREAIAGTEELRESLIGDASQRTGFMERSTRPYHTAMHILAERGELEAALEMAERVKGRALLETLTDTGSKIEALTPDEAKRDRELWANITTLNRKLREEKNEKTIAALARARQEYESFQLAIDVAHPRRKAAQGIVPIAAPKDIAALLRQSVAVVEYVVADDRTRVFVVTANGVESATIAIKKDDLNRRVTELADALAQNDLEYKRAARSLYALLLGPIEHALRGQKAICVIPDAALWRLPFEALIDGKGRFTIESRASFYAPSMSVLAAVTRETKREPAPSMLLAVGNPTVSASTSNKVQSRYRDSQLRPLKAAETEVRELRELYGAANSRIYIGAAATKAAIESQIENYRVLHFATHGIVDEQEPLYSQVVLAQSGDAHDDGLLQARELMRANLRADIAVLSACETARGRVAAGEGIIGFTWALFVAGCPSSVVSQWKVDSESTSRLMVGFHRNLLATDSPLAKAEALRAAKLALLRGAKWRHPFYWSPFVLVGSPQSFSSRQ